MRRSVSTALRHCGRAACTAAPPWEVVVGLEFHVQVAAAAKLFSPSRAAAGLPPNSAVAPFDTAQPGSLPVLNPEAVEAAVRLGLALGGEVQPVSVFERKHYTYADLPHGYQVTQQARPVVLGGALWLLPDGEEGEPQRLSVERVQLEMDTAKTSRAAAGGPPQLDYNRAGCALLEVVTAPELRSGAQAAAAVLALQRLLRHTGVSSGALEDGSLRCDVNVSLRRPGAAGARTEVKNLNSVRSVQRAVAFEARRQAALLDAGQPVPRQTLGFDAASGRTEPLRGKESALDYRFLPEPDLPPLLVSPQLLARLRAAAPELPDAARARLQLRERLPAASARLLCAQPATLAYFDATLAALRAAGEPPAPEQAAREAANWVLGDATRCARAAGLPGLQSPPAAAAPQRLARLLRALAGGGASGPRAKAALAAAFRAEAQPLDALLAEAEAAAAAGAPAARDAAAEAEALRALCEAVLAEHPRQAAAWRAGRDRMMGLFVGQALQRTGGRADPVAANRIFTQLLRSEEGVTA